MVANLGVLGWFKYYGFFVTSVVNFLGVFGLNADLPLLRIVLPIGISFLTFRVLSYVIDVYRGTLRTASMLDFAVYVAFFPYTLAGPIARASEFLPQLKAPRDPRRVDTSRAFFLIFAGLAKKMLLADYLATHIVNGVFTTPGEYSSLEILVGIIGYSVQIYCDFSAYADIAIGISLLLGFELPDNFDAPYTAVSVQDFWRRWHMTLSRWLRDYLYIPLGGNRKGQARTYVNLMLTMLLGGLWHGAGWTFIFWGALYGGALVVEHRRLDVRKARAAPAAARRPSGAGRPAVAGGRRTAAAMALGSATDGGGDSDLDRSARALAAMAGGPAFARRRPPVRRLRPPCRRARLPAVSPAPRRRSTTSVPGAAAGCRASACSPSSPSPGCSSARPRSGRRSTCSPSSSAAGAAWAPPSPRPCCW